MIIFEGNDRYAYRDPACCMVDGVYYLFFTVSEKQEGYMYNYLGMSKSTDLKQWTEPRILTEKNLKTNFTSPGNIIKKGEEYAIRGTLIDKKNKGGYIFAIVTLREAEKIVSVSVEKLALVDDADFETESFIKNQSQTVDIALWKSLTRPELISSSVWQ